MAMSNCRECGKTVSTKAKTCPNCGAPKPAKKLKIKKLKTKVKKKNFISQGIKDFKRGFNEETEKEEGKYGKNKKTPSPEDKNYIDWVNKWGKKSEGRSYTPNPSYEPPSSQSSSSSSNSQSEDNTFEKFMNGDLDLATSFWGFLIVGTMIIGFVCGFLSEAYGKGWVIPLAIYTYLAVAGTWQAAEKYKIQQSKKKQTEVWGVLTQAVCVLNVISVISVLYETFVK